MGLTKEKLMEERKHRKQIEAAKAAIVAGMHYPPRTAARAGKFRLFSSQGTSRLLSAMAVVAASVMVVWLIRSGDGIPDFITDVANQITSPATPGLPAIGDTAHVLEALPPPAAGQTPREAGVANEPQQTFADEPTRTEETSSIAAVVTIEPPYVHQTDSEVSEKPASPGQSTDTVEGGQSSIREPVNTATSTEGKGPWVINLASLSSKADADRLAEKARSRDIETVMQQVTVNGKQYWRVQITGFSTATEAKADSGVVKAKLGLKDVWIMKR